MEGMGNRVCGQDGFVAIEVNQETLLSLVQDFPGSLIV